jgi:hypothetical protein
MRRWWLALWFGLLPTWAGAAAPDADWPCQQRLVPTLSAATMWNGPAGTGDWRAEPRVAGLVDRIAPRAVSAEEGAAAIAAFVEPLSKGRRRRLVPLVFTGLFEETNRQRSELIARIKDLGERQRKLAALVADVTRQLDAAAPGGGAPQVELEQRATYLTRSFEGGQRTMRYACEAPSELESRLGTWARALEAALH